MLPGMGLSAWGAHAACAEPGRHDQQRTLRSKVCFGLNVHENLNVTGGQSTGPWQPANAMLGVCIPLAFGEEKKCGGGLPRDPLADHLWPQAAARQSHAVEGPALPLGPGSTGAPARVAPVQGLLDAAGSAGLVSSSRRFSWLERCWRQLSLVWPRQGQRGCGVGGLATAESSGLCVSSY